MDRKVDLADILGPGNRGNLRSLLENQLHELVRPKIESMTNRRRTKSKLLL